MTGRPLDVLGYLEGLRDKLGEEIKLCPMHNK